MNEIKLTKTEAEFARLAREKRAIRRANRAFDRNERAQKRIAAATSAALFSLTIVLIVMLLIQ